MTAMPVSYHLTVVFLSDAERVAASHYQTTKTAARRRGPLII